MLPDISVIMPTTEGRVGFIPLALENLKSQKDLKIQLVVATEHDKAKAAVIQAVQQLDLWETVLVSSVAGTSLGNKRNACCFQARAPWIACWDDDDWRGSKYLVSMLGTLQKYKTFTGMYTMLEHELVDHRRRTAVYKFGLESIPYYIGGTLGFARSLWYKHPFQDVPKSEDMLWQENLPIDVRAASHEFSSDPTQYVRMLHGKNTAFPQTPLVVGDPQYSLWPYDLTSVIPQNTLKQYVNAGARIHGI